MTIAEIAIMADNQSGKKSIDINSKKDTRIRVAICLYYTN